MPRPRKPEPDTRSQRLNLRLTASEGARVRQAAQATGVSTTDYARRAVLTAVGAAVPSRPTATVIDPAAIAALSRVGANLNQLARRANAGDLLQPGELPDSLAAIAHQLDRIEALVLPALDRDA